MNHPVTDFHCRLILHSVCRKRARHRIRWFFGSMVVNFACDVKKTPRNVHSLCSQNEITRYGRAKTNGRQNENIRFGLLQFRGWNLIAHRKFYWSSLFRRKVSIDVYFVCSMLYAAVKAGNFGYLLANEIDVSSWTFHKNVENFLLFAAYGTRSIFANDPNWV